MPYTIVIAVPEPVSWADNIELDRVQAYFVEESEEYNGWYAGYKPAIIRKLGIENIDIYYMGCFENDDDWSSFNLIKDSKTDSYLHITKDRFKDFVTVFETLMSFSKVGKLYMILHNGISIRDDAEVSYLPKLPSERYVDYNVEFIQWSEFLQQVNSKTTIFEVESIWEISKM